MRVYKNGIIFPHTCTQKCSLDILLLSQKNFCNTKRWAACNHRFTKCSHEYFVTIDLQNIHMNTICRMVRVPSFDGGSAIYTKCLKTFRLLPNIWIMNSHAVRKNPKCHPILLKWIYNHPLTTSTSSKLLTESLTFKAPHKYRYGSKLHIQLYSEILIWLQITFNFAWESQYTTVENKFVTFLTYRWFETLNTHVKFHFIYFIKGQSPQWSKI